MIQSKTIEPVSGKSKRCRKCGHVKAFSDFRTRSCGRPDSYCRPCRHRINNDRRSRIRKQEKAELERIRIHADRNLHMVHSYPLDGFNPMAQQFLAMKL